MSSLRNQASRRSNPRVPKPASTRPADKERIANLGHFRNVAVPRTTPPKAVPLFVLFVVVIPPRRSEYSIFPSHHISLLLFFFSMLLNPRLCCTFVWLHNRVSAICVRWGAATDALVLGFAPPSAVANACVPNAHAARMENPHTIFLVISLASMTCILVYRVRSTRPNNPSHSRNS